MLRYCLCEEESCCTVRDCGLAVSVTLRYQNIERKLFCFYEPFVNSSPLVCLAHSGAFMLSTMLIFRTWRRMARQTISVKTKVSTTLYKKLKGEMVRMNII